LGTSVLNGTNAIRIIDWDEVSTVPLKLSAVSMEGSLWRPPPRMTLDRNQVELFHQDLGRIEQERSSSTEWSRMFLHSTENQFLIDILRPQMEYTFAGLGWKYPEIFAEALERSPEALESAAAEWKSFTDLFTSQGLRVPEFPQYIEIKEALGIYGRSSLERAFRKLKRAAQKRLNVFRYQIWRKTKMVNSCENN